ncbi:hypothetical protein INT43_001262 [Umbelopsis isabellina]|uniref:Uncharacterized protein n=1 Tax=Mortierella isabellina TaxID=91625 RepID=A0A8H7PKW8_MORIS|nr:hypothetical protein INT43_001262 [Umbelopsis isabellina]
MAEQAQFSCAKRVAGVKPWQKSGDPNRNCSPGSVTSGPKGIQPACHKRQCNNLSWQPWSPEHYFIMNRDEVSYSACIAFQDRRFILDFSHDIFSYVELPLCINASHNMFLVVLPLLVCQRADFPTSDRKKPPKEKAGYDTIVMGSRFETGISSSGSENYGQFTSAPTTNGNRKRFSQAQKITKRAGVF